MNILYYDCFAGISGDMNLAAMLDLGVDQGYLLQQLARLNLSGYHIEVSQAQRHSISGTQVNVQLTEAQPHRSWQTIQKIIKNSKLSDSVKQRSLAVFHQLAQAEAQVHGVEAETIHFHEVGAIDALIDIVGAAICLEALAVDKILCSTVELGGGWVECAHGVMPVPVPATVALLAGKPTRLGRVAFETTTPTGAALLATHVDEFTDTPAFTIEKIAYGIGHRETPIPNVLRVYLGEYTPVEAQLYNLACNIDDMNPEFYDYVMTQLFEHGALDVYLTPIIMKKSRPATVLTVLSPAALVEKMTAILLTETTTLGVRQTPVRRTTLTRTVKTISTSYGTITLKLAYYQGKLVNMKPEYADCQRLARQHGVALKTIYQAIDQYFYARS